MKEWLISKTSELGCYCNQVPYDKSVYNIYLIMCKLIGWL